jgi:hypothetical protein
MRIIDANRKKKLTTQLNKVKKIGSKELVSFIQNRYSEDDISFHRLFMHTGFIYGMEIQEINDVISDIDKDQVKIKEDLQFIEYLLQKRNDYEDEIAEIIKSNIKRVSIESLFEYLSLVHQNNLINNKNWDGVSYPSDILESQFEHLLDCFSEIVEIIKKYKVKSTEVRFDKQNVDIYRRIYKLIAQKVSIKEHILSIMTEMYHVKRIQSYEYNSTIINDVFLKTHSLSFWKRFELYRDLNFSQFTNELDQSEEFEIFQKSGYVKLFSQEKIVMDESKGIDFLVYKSFYKASKLLAPMYGEVHNKSFTYKNTEYSVNSLIELNCGLLKVSFRQSLKLENGEANILLKYGEKSLLRRIGFPTKMRDLLSLLSVDLDNLIETSFQVSYKPLIRKGNVYYILPSFFEHISIEKCVDRILSNDVVVKNVNQSNEKGYFFEKQIEGFFKKTNIKFSKVSRDEDKGIPEFDGLFTLDNHVFIFEAKATVKPETIVEVYNNLQGKVREGFEQLKDRIEALMDEEKRKVIEEKTGLEIKNKKISPFILMNHFYFNGYQDLLYNNGGVIDHIPIIDFFTLKSILSKKKFNMWKYIEKTKCYKCIEVDYKSADDLYNYMLNQINGLLSEEEPEFQITEDYIVSQIWKPISICNDMYD